jgi:PadR family transcriptional regulator, regulatory protein PadR
MAVDRLHACPDSPTMPKSPRGQNRIELLQGTLDLLILQSLRWGPQHGYGLSQLIRTHSGERLQVDTGSLYPALHRLERAGVIAADWKMSDNKQRVRVYRLTAAGRKQLVAERSRWDELSQAIAGVLNPPGLESEG